MLIMFDMYRTKWLSASQRAADEKTFGPLREWFKKNFANAK